MLLLMFVLLLDNTPSLQTARRGPPRDYKGARLEFLQEQSLHGSVVTDIADGSSFMDLSPVEAAVLLKRCMHQHGM